MKLRFLDAALNELIDAANYYEAQRAGLGHEFEIAFQTGLDQVLRMPTAWPRLTGEIRRYRLKKFPFGIVYRIGKGEITIGAVMHLHREPGYWADRL